jgi:hypothetical protein
MASQEDVRRIATSLPEVSEEQGRFAFRVRGKAFAWIWLERPEPNGPRIPNAGVLAIRVDGELEKESLIAVDPDAFFSEPHYAGFPAVLARLPKVDAAMLEDLLVKGWRIQASWRIQAGKRLASTLTR